MSGILSTQVSHILRRQTGCRFHGRASAAAISASARALLCVAWVARPKPGPASPANMSKRGLFARHRAPNQTLIMVKGGYQKGNFGGWKCGAGPGPLRGARVPAGPFRGLAWPLPVQRPAARPTRRHSDAVQARERVPWSRLPRHRSWQSHRADVTENGSPGAEQDTCADPGRAIRRFGPSSDGDVLHDGHPVTDDDKRTHDDAGRMIEEYRGPDRRGGVNAHLKGIG